MNDLQDLGLTCTLRPAWTSPCPSVHYQPPFQTIYGAAFSPLAIDLSGATAAWVIEAAKKLDRLGRFRADWDSYGGLPLKPSAKNLTLRVLEWLRKDELPVPAVVLGSGGTVQLEWKAKGKELEVELRDNDTIEFVKVSPSGNIEEGETSVNLSGKLHDLTSWLLQS